MIDDPMIGHDGSIITASPTDDTIRVTCTCGWRRDLHGTVAPQDPMRAWTGHAWRVTLGIEEVD